MKITKPNTKLADEVVRHLRSKEQPKGVAHMWLKLYSNCREQGYVLHVECIDFKTNLYFTFSENRNSDRVVVYRGDWNLSAAAASAAYDTAEYFGSPREAANSIECDIIRESSKVLEAVTEEHEAKLRAK